jgi:hypothetical protein
MTQAHCHPQARELITRAKPTATADWKPFAS